MRDETITSKFYLPPVDGLRTLAFFFVFIHHLGPNENTPIYNRFITCGWVGLDLFFVLSGFLITSILIREKELYGYVSMKKFMMRRILRIWPLYIVTIFLGFVLFPMFGAFGIKIFSPKWYTMVNDYFWTFSLFIGNMSFAWKLTIISPIFAALWSAGVEEQFYIAWGCVFSFVKCNLNKLLIFTWVFSILCRIIIYSYAEVYQAYYYCTFSHLDPLVLGCLLGINYQKLKNVNQKASALIFVLSLAVFAILWNSNPLEENMPSNIAVFIYSAVSMVLLFFSGITNRILIQILSSKFLVYFAKYTYGMYIFHTFSILVTNKITGSHFSFTRLVIAFALSFVMGFICWHTIEKWFISLKKHEFSPIQTGFST